MRPVDVGNLGKGLQLLDELLVQSGQFTGMKGSPMGSGTRVLDAGSQLPHQRLRSQGPERDLGGLLGAPLQDTGEIRSSGRQPHLLRIGMARAQQRHVRRPARLLGPLQQIRTRCGIADHDQLWRAGAPPCRVLRA
ncbi:hypothetical protein [Streptomyces mirabilis]|uniref:hypothetical protein n=1 Tax=Streptomyces mirabilis TaxID=68239 RepID=UPI00332E891D